MNKLTFVLGPLMATTLVVMAQFGPTRKPDQQSNISSEDTASLPFSTTANFFATTPRSSLRGSSRRFAFAFAARTTTTVLPPLSTNNVPSTTTNRASIRFFTTSPATISNGVIVSTTTEIPLIDDDTGQDVMAFKGERLPLSTTTQSSTTSTSLPITAITNRRPFNNLTLRPSNRTILQRPVGLMKHHQRVVQALHVSNKTTTTTRASNRNPIQIVTENNKNSTKPIHVQTELDPELTELRKRITAGINAQRLLRERLKQASSRFQTTNIQKVFSPIKSRLGVSRRKTAVAPKQSGVKTTLGDLGTKRRVEGRLKHTVGHIHTGRAGSPSPVIAKRFHSDESSQKQQVQVEPSTVQMEKFENNAINAAAKLFSAGPSALIDDENSNDNLRRTTKFETFHGHKDQPTNSGEIQSKPAFCRRCYRFWRNVSTTKVNKSAIYQYCCTIGSNKGEKRHSFTSLLGRYPI